MTAKPITLTWRSHGAGPAFRIYGGQSPKLVKLLMAAGFDSDPVNACWLAQGLRDQRAANAYALAAVLTAAGYSVTHAGCYGAAGPSAPLEA